jgi:hypothetical protein
LRCTRPLAPLPELANARWRTPTRPRGGAFARRLRRVLRQRRPRGPTRRCGSCSSVLSVR